MIDTPGHVDFSGRVIRSLRAIDGSVVVCDAVEGIMTQTETVTRMSLEERVRPVLYINKIDRLIKELRLTPEKMQETLASVVANFNELIDTYAEEEFKEKWKVSINSLKLATTVASVSCIFSGVNLNSLISLSILLIYKTGLTRSSRDISSDSLSLSHYSFNCITYYN